MPVSRLCAFGPYRLDFERRRLLRGTELVPIQQKALEILFVLVERHGELVSKDQLMQSVWPDAFVEESNLTQNIFVLRKVLGEGPKENQYIATIPGRGYCFVATLDEHQEPPMQRGNEASHSGSADNPIANATKPSDVDLALAVPQFTGQTRRAQIDASLKREHCLHPILAVEGLPGSGKTFAVSQFVYNLSQERGGSVYWHSARVDETLDELLIQLAPIYHAHAETMEARCTALVQNLHQNNSVIVIDDFHVVDPISYSQLIESAAKSGNPATVILISRIFVDAGRHWPLIGHFEVGGFETSELGAYLLSRRITVNNDVLSTLHIKTDGLPLAATLFATLVGQFNQDPVHLLRGEMVHDVRLRSWFDELSTRLDRDERSLLATLSAYEAPFNRDLVQFLGSHLTIADVNHVFEKLQRKYLVQRDTPYRWKVHHLIASYSSSQLSHADRQNLMIQFAAQSLKGIDLERQSRISEENVVWVSRAIRFFQRAERFDRSGRLLEKLAPIAKDGGFHNLFILVAEYQLREDDSAQGWIAYHLAHCYQIVGQITRAFAISRRIVDSNSDSDKNKRLSALRLHAELLVSIHQYSEAHRTISDALSGMNADVAPTIQNHARQIEVMILTKLGDFKKAAELAQKLLADSAVKGQLRGVAVAKMRLGLIKLEQDELRAALEYFEQAPNDFKQIGDVRGEAWALTHLSEVLLRLGVIKLLIWQAYFGDGPRPSQRDLARQLGVSPSYVCKVQKRAAEGLDALARGERVTLEELADARRFTAKLRDQEPGLLAPVTRFRREAVPPVQEVSNSMRVATPPASYDPYAHARGCPCLACAARAMIDAAIARGRKRDEAGEL
jgi:DNA-binding winged helix-turn-helix (wHTH) protein/tetratricopeptide (TPR) repeat protein